MDEVVTLRDGSKIPRLGFGTWLINSVDILTFVLKNGYRLIDTATTYENEEDVGRAICESGIPREKIYVITKVWDDDHGREATRKAFELSLKKLGLDYVDMYMMHSPAGGKVLETWDTMIELQKQGLVKSLAVSNFGAGHIRELKKARPDNMPLLNQIEINPFLNWDECVKVCKEEKIVVQAYCPLSQGGKLNNPTIVEIAQKYDRSRAQIMIRWSLQRGFVCIPRSSKESRIIENSKVFDFELSEEDMQRLTALDEHFVCVDDWPAIMEHPWEP